MGLSIDVRACFLGVEGAVLYLSIYHFVVFSFFRIHDTYVMSLLLLRASCLSVFCLDTLSLEVAPAELEVSNTADCSLFDGRVLDRVGGKEIARISVYL